MVYNMGIQPRTHLMGILLSCQGGGWAFLVEGLGMGGLPCCKHLIIFVVLIMILMINYRENHVMGDKLTRYLVPLHHFYFAILPLLENSTSDFHDWHPIAIFTTIIIITITIPPTQSAVVARPSMEAGLDHRRDGVRWFLITLIWEFHLTTAEVTVKKCPDSHVFERIQWGFRFWLILTSNPQPLSPGNDFLRSPPWWGFCTHLQGDPQPTIRATPGSTLTTPPRFNVTCLFSKGCCATSSPPMNKSSCRPLPNPLVSNQRKPSQKMLVTSL